MSYQIAIILLVMHYNTDILKKSLCVSTHSDNGTIVIVNLCGGWSAECSAYCRYENGYCSLMVRFVNGMTKRVVSTSIIVPCIMLVFLLKSSFGNKRVLVYSDHQACGYLVNDCFGIAENTMKVKLIYEYRNGILIRYDENGRGRSVEEWERILVLLSNRINPNIHFHPDSMMVYDIGSEQSYGMLEWNQKYFVIDWSNDVNRVTMIDLNRNEMVVYENGEEVKLDCVDDVIDLSVNGKRWEGKVRDGKPFGYGVMYDEEGRKEYEGFMMNGVKSVKGVEYYSDIGRVKYDGCLYNDEYNGRGILYNRNRMVEYDGLWKNGKPYCNQFDGLTIDNHTESIEIVNNSFNEVKFFIPPFFLYSLKRLLIRDDCFERARLFELNGLIELKSVVIGVNSISANPNEPWNSERSDGVFSIVNCLKLESIQIGHYSFGDFHSFELTNLPSLQTIDIGYMCFYWSPSFSLTGLIG